MPARGSADHGRRLLRAVLRCLFEWVRARAMPGTSLDAVWACFTSLRADRLRVLRNLLRSTRAAGEARRGAVSKHRVHARAGSCPTRKYAATNLLGVGFQCSESDGFGAAVQGWGYLRFAARTHAGRATARSSPRKLPVECGTCARACDRRTSRPTCKGTPALNVQRSPEI